MSDYTETTIDYYNQNADSFVLGTANADMGPVREAFLAYIPAGGRILDLGCGSGRDSRAFLEAGYAVTSVDGSQKLCRAAEALTGQKVVCSLFQDYVPDGLYDGIWACASLLHLKREELVPVIAKYAAALKDQGCFYMSFKKGSFSGERRGRYFTDMTEAEADSLLRNVPALTLSRLFVTGDVRPARGREEWLNIFAVKENTK